MAHPYQTMLNDIEVLESKNRDLQQQLTDAKAKVREAIERLEKYRVVGNRNISSGLREIPAQIRIAIRKLREVIGEE